MKKRTAELILKDPEKFAHHDRVFLNNPVVMQGMGLAPLVVVATTGQNGLMLAAAVTLLLVPSRVLACLLSRLVPLRDEEPTPEQLQKKLLPRALLYAASAAVVYLAAYPILNFVFGTGLLNLGIYLPMLVVEPLLTYRFGRVQETVHKAVSKGVRITVGYALLLLVIGMLREWLSLGTVFGAPVGRWDAGGRLYRAGHPVRHLARCGCKAQGISEKGSTGYPDRALPEGGKPRTVKEVVSSSAVFFSYALLAIFAQNAVFTRALGVSRMVQLVGDDRTSSALFGMMLCITQVLVAPVAFLAGRFIAPLDNRAQLRPLVYIASIAVVCLAEHLVLWLLRSLPRRAQLLRIVPLAALNSGVLGTVLVERTQSFTLGQSLGFGLGSGLGYVLAVLLVTEARHRLRSKAIPKAFRGLPITLVYIGVLALAIYGFTGHSVIL